MGRPGRRREARRSSGSRGLPGRGTTPPPSAVYGPVTWLSSPDPGGLCRPACFVASRTAGRVLPQGELDLLCYSEFSVSSADPAELWISSGLKSSPLSAWRGGARPAQGRGPRLLPPGKPADQANLCKRIWYWEGCGPAGLDCHDHPNHTLGRRDCTRLTSVPGNGMCEAAQFFSDQARQRKHPRERS